MLRYSLRSIETAFLAIGISFGVQLFRNFEVFADDRPNILVVVADDLGYSDVGFQGSVDVPTPHLDGLAKSASGVQTDTSRIPFVVRPALAFSLDAINNALGTKTIQLGSQIAQ